MAKSRLVRIGLILKEGVLNQNTTHLLIRSQCQIKPDKNQVKVMKSKELGQFRFGWRVQHVLWTQPGVDQFRDNIRLVGNF